MACINWRKGWGRAEPAGWRRAYSSRPAGAVVDCRGQDLVDLGVRLAIGPPEEPADHLDQFRDGVALAENNRALSLGPVEAFLAGVQGDDDVRFAAVVQVGFAGLPSLLRDEIEHFQVAD